MTAGLFTTARGRSRRDRGARKRHARLAAGTPQTLFMAAGGMCFTDSHVAQALVGIPRIGFQLRANARMHVIGRFQLINETVLPKK